MPFSVQPSNSVVISGQSITDNDFLKVILEDGAVLYIRSKCDMNDTFLMNYTFDQEFLPKGIAKNIKGIVEKWYKDSYVSNKYQRSRIREEHADLFRKKGGLRGQLQSQLASSLYVYNSNEAGARHKLDIGYRVRVMAYCLTEGADIFNASQPSAGDYRNNHWTFTAPIAAILSTDRATIRKELMEN
jgi:hypothetical protein